MILALTPPKSVHGVQCAQIWFEMDDLTTIGLIQKGLVKHSIQELREMSGYEQMKAGAVGLSDMVDDLDPDDKRTYAVYITSDCGFRNILADFATEKEALAVAMHLANKYHVDLENRFNSILQRGEAEEIAKPFMKDIPL